MIKQQKVLIVGGGFAGVKAALELSDDENYSVSLLSDEPNLRYYPTLYHTATGGTYHNSSIPLTVIFENRDVNIFQGSAETLDRKAKTITTADGEVYEYDYLLLCLGVVTNYFGIPGLDEFAYGIKSQKNVADFKKHLHKQLVEEGKPDVNYIIVGAGPTGIELSGALPHYLKEIIKNHKLGDNRKAKIELIEAMPRLLPNLPKNTSNNVRKRLKKLDIKLMVNSKVEGETADALTVNGQPLSSHTVVWTAGVTNHPFFQNNHFVMMGRGKVAVDIYLQSEPNIFILGDNANTPFSGMAQTALHDAEFVTKNLKLKAMGRDFKSYKAKKPITVIPCGPNWAAVVMGRFHFFGLIGNMLREGAEFRGFKEFEPWFKATKQFLSEYAIEDDCEVCAIKNF
jgi:NADH:ubiquinone reductase (H+-translocating)